MRLLPNVGVKRTVGQDIQALLALGKVFDGLLDAGHVRQINVKEFQATVRARVSGFDLIDGGISLALGAASYVYGAIVLVENLA